MAAHKCPAPGCNTVVPQHMLACRPHWYSIPKPLRDAVWAGYRWDAGGPDHTAAIRDAIAFLNSRKVSA